MTVLTHKIFGMNFGHILAKILSFHVSQSAMFSFIDFQQENRVIANHLLLIFKFNDCKSRGLKTLNFLCLKSDILNIRQIEENLCRNDIRKQRN